MLGKVEQHNDWQSKHQAALEELQQRKREWTQIEALLRKTIERISTAGQGLDARLDQQLHEIHQLTRAKRNEKLGQALKQLAQIVASLENPKATQKSRRSGSIKLMLELLQGIHFDSDQRQRLKTTCSDLLKSVANGAGQDAISGYVKELASLINENFGRLDSDSKSTTIVFKLLDLLNLETDREEKIRLQFNNTGELREQELQSLAQLINEQLNPGSVSTSHSIDDVMTTLLERLAIVEGVNGAAQAIQTRVHDGIADEHWAQTLNEIVASIAGSLRKLDHEKKELEDFIVGVTAQLGKITQVIAAGHEDHLCDHEDTQSLHDFVQEGMSLIQKNFQSSNDLQQLKTSVGSNIESIRDGVDNFVNRINERHEATEVRNQKLTAQLSQMEEETQELQVMLTENREKLLYDALTGVYSRMAYDDRINQELARWNRYQTPFSYVIVDIDHFKKINDEYGHNAGDKALKIIAQTMLKHVRQSDYVFRIGGEEFVLLLSGTQADKANDMIEKMRAAITKSSFHFKGERISVTLSAGVTDTRENDDAESIYERADAALYKAKHSGRNCQFIAE